MPHLTLSQHINHDANKVYALQRTRLAPMRDAALAFRMAINLARQACPVLMEPNQHAALIAWVQGCVEASSATDAGDMQAVADVVVTMATHPLLRMTGDRVCVHRRQGA
jgi:hypothetical protein